MQRELDSWAKHSGRLEVQHEQHALPSYRQSSSCLCHTLGATLHLVLARHLPLPIEGSEGVRYPELVVYRLE